MCIRVCVCVCVVCNKGKVGKEQEDPSLLELMGNSPNEGGVWLNLVTKDKISDVPVCSKVTGKLGSLEATGKHMCPPEV